MKREASNDRSDAVESDRLVGDAEEFIEDVFGSLEHAFIEHFGQRWTPEINELFQSSQRACRAVAQEVDGEPEVEARYVPTNKALRLLSNYKKPRG